MTQMVPHETRVQSVRLMLGTYHKQMTAAATKFVTPRRACAVALQHVWRDPALSECSAQSLTAAVMRCVELGLEPGAAELVYFIPFRNEITLIIGYKGMIELALRSDRIYDVNARVVRDGDDFDYSYGTEEHLTHNVRGLSDRNITHCYAIARLSNGLNKFLVLDYPELMRHKEMSLSRQKQVWRDHEAAMCEKTALRMLFKTIGGGTALNTAMHLQNEADAGESQGLPVSMLPDDPTSGAQAIPPGDNAGTKPQDAKSLEDLTPNEEPQTKPAPQAAAQVSKLKRVGALLKRVEALRKEITEGAIKLPGDQFAKFLKNCSLDNVQAVKDITDVKQLESIRDALEA